MMQTSGLQAFTDGLKFKIFIIMKKREIIRTISGRNPRRWVNTEVDIKPVLTKKDIVVNSPDQKIELDLSKHDHFRIWLDGTFEFDMPMPINSYDGQEFIIELRSKKFKTFNDPEVDCWIGFNYRWFAKNLQMQIATGDLLVVGATTKYVNDETSYIKQEQVDDLTRKTLLHITDPNGVCSFWFLECIVLNDVVLDYNFDSQSGNDVLTYVNGILIKEVSPQSPFAEFTDRSLVYGADWNIVR
jgi:hypothetical protein